MPKQSQKEINDFYKSPDPWGYVANKDDEKRKEIILEELKPFGRFQRALDIGCGEGWITKDLNADIINGYEISDNAAERLPKNIRRIKKIHGLYDLIIATGVLYEHYDVDLFHEIIKNHASKIVLTCNIKDWEKNRIPNFYKIKEFEFPYREYVERLCIYDFTSPHR